MGALNSKDLQDLCQCALRAAQEAGEFIAAYAEKKVKVNNKRGGVSMASQVVTEVDLGSQTIILKHLTPTLDQYDLALLAEETEDDLGRLEKDFFWCIDPLDGTLQFTQGKPGFAVSIALVSRQGVSHIGVIFDPIKKVLYHAVRGQGSFRNGQPFKKAGSEHFPGNVLTFMADQSIRRSQQYPEIKKKLEAFAKQQGLNALETIDQGGSVMCACRMLERAPACFFKLPKPEKGGGNLWDFAATACLLEEWGARISDFFGDPLELNRKESTFMNHKGVIYASDDMIYEEVRTIKVSN